MDTLWKVLKKFSYFDSTKVEDEDKRDKLASRVNKWQKMDKKTSLELSWARMINGIKSHCNQAVSITEYSLIFTPHYPSTTHSPIRTKKSNGFAWSLLHQAWDYTPFRYCCCLGIANDSFELSLSWTCFIWTKAVQYLPKLVGNVLHKV